MGSPWLLGNRVSSWVSHAPLPSLGSWWILYMTGSHQEPPHSGGAEQQIRFPLESPPRSVRSMQAMPVSGTRLPIKDTGDWDLDKIWRRPGWVASVRKQPRPLSCPRFAANCHILEGDRLLQLVRTGSCCLSVSWSCVHVFTPTNSPRCVGQERSYLKNTHTHKFSSLDMV